MLLVGVLYATRKSGWCSGLAGVCTIHASWNQMANLETSISYAWNTHSEFLGHHIPWNILDSLVVKITIYNNYILIFIQEYTKEYFLSERCLSCLLNINGQTTPYVFHLFEVRKAFISPDSTLFIFNAFDASVPPMCLMAISADSLTADIGSFLLKRKDNKQIVRVCLRRMISSIYTSSKYI